MLKPQTLKPIALEAYPGFRPRAYGCTEQMELETRSQAFEPVLCFNIDMVL